MKKESYKYELALSYAHKDEAIRVRYNRDKSRNSPF